MRSSKILPLTILIVLGSSILDVSGQTPQIIPRARLLGEAPAASRPRRVFNAPKTVTPASDANSIERRAFDSTNEARIKNGLAPLVWDSLLFKVARMHSESMVQQNYFAHETPTGDRLRDRVRAAGIAHFRVLGENIAYNQGFEDPGAFAVERWLISPGHRANILSGEFEKSAVGICIASDGTVYLTQVFMKQ